MNSNMITCFLETVRCGSFSRAAETLFFAQQTVSRHVSLLEAELVTCSGAGVSLTREGEYYFTLFTHSRQDQERLHQNIASYQTALRGTLRIGCSEWLMPYDELIPAIQLFRAEHPDLRVSFSVYSNKELLFGLEHGTTDLAFFSEGHLPDDRICFNYAPICEEKLCIVGPADIVGPELPRESREKRRDRTFLIVPAWERGYIENKEFSRQELQNLDIPLKQVHLVSNFDSMLAMMRQKRYLAFSDVRFGAFTRIEGLGCEPLGVTSHLFGCTPYQSENSYAPLLLEHLKTVLNN